MRVLALLFILLGLPTFAAAADYTPWPTQDEPAACNELAQAPPAGQQPGGQGKPTPSLSGGDYPGRYCCFHCRSNEIPCGGECISKTGAKKDFTCKLPAGCACPGKP